MFRRILALVLTLCPATLAQEGAGGGGKVDARYTFTLDPATPAVRVLVDAKGRAGGRAEFNVQEEWGGVSGNGKEIFDVSATGEGGRALVVSAASDHAWRVEHNPGESLTASYTLRQPPDRAPSPKFNDYRTHIRPGLFQMIGNIGLLIPATLEGETPRTFEVRWRGFDEAGWTVASSFGPGSGPRTVTLKPDQFRQSLFIAGALRCPTRTIKGRTIGLAIYGDDWGFTDERFADLVERVIAAERDFCDDHTDPWFLVSMIPTGRATRQSLSLGGTGLTNCFALFCNTGLDLSPASDHEHRILHLLAHEYFHTWNGTRLHAGGPEGSAYWFSEGFTDYFARRILFKAGLYTSDAFAREHNQSLARYLASPVKNAPNTRVIAEFWSSPDVNQLPYLRGNLIALAADQRIRDNSDGQRSLDDLMRDMVRRAREGDQPADSDAVLSAIAAATDPEFAASVRAAVVDGADVPLPETLTEPSLVLETRQMREFDPGFDARGSREAGTIKGVREGSEAWKAGLRDGQKLLAININSGSGTTPPSGMVKVGEDGMEREIKYGPLSEPKPVRAYVPRTP